jgi:hypothetical protein
MTTSKFVSAKLMMDSSIVTSAGNVCLLTERKMSSKWIPHLLLKGDIKNFVCQVLVQLAFL